MVVAPGRVVAVPPGAVVAVESESSPLLFELSAVLTPSGAGSSSMTRISTMAVRTASAKIATPRQFRSERSKRPQPTKSRAQIGAYGVGIPRPPHERTIEWVPASLLLASSLQRPCAASPGFWGRARPRPARHHDRPDRPPRARRRGVLRARARQPRSSPPRDHRPRGWRSAARRRPTAWCSSPTTARSTTSVSCGASSKRPATPS